MGVVDYQQEGSPILEGSSNKDWDGPVLRLYDLPYPCEVSVTGDVEEHKWILDSWPTFKNEILIGLPKNTDSVTIVVESDEGSGGMYCKVYDLENSGVNAFPVDEILRISPKLTTPDPEQADPEQQTLNLTTFDQAFRTLVT